MSKYISFLFLLFIGFALCFPGIVLAQNGGNVFLLDEIPVRDPYILPVPEDQTYYLYSATRDGLKGSNGRQGICVYTSKDLKKWQGPNIIFEEPDGFWADPDHGVWAPEVHRYKGKYYLFATFTNETRTIGTLSDGFKLPLRGTQILLADCPTGPFEPFCLNKPATPNNWMALDGTLWIENNEPYMVFCHEWIQVNEGTYEMVQLEADLSKMEGKPTTIFKANDAPWVKRMDLLGKKYKGESIHGFVSDGPFIYRLPSRKLICLTSSFAGTGYSLSYAVSESGNLIGPWTHPSEPLLTGGHGHGMLFRSFDNKLMLTCHYPNSNPSRAVLYEIETFDNGIRIIGNYED